MKENGLILAGVVGGLVAVALLLVFLNLFRPGFISFDWSVLAGSVTGDAPRVACPMIAKLCPNGTSVGPTGPNCEFAPCPKDPLR